MAVCRVERTGDYTTMSNHHLRNKALSLKAKGLLSLMLSLPETWNYTAKGLAHISKEGIDGITSTIKELERAGYVERRRVRDSSGRLRTTEYIIREFPVETNTDTPVLEKSDLSTPILTEPTSEKPSQDNPLQLSTKAISTKKQNTNISNTDQSITHSYNQQIADSLTDGKEVRARIKEQIEYSCMVQRYRRDQLDEIVEIMVEVAMNRSSFIRIGKDSEFATSFVQERFNKINALHIEHVMEGLLENVSQVKNTKAYLMKTLFNSVSTIENSYTFQHNYEFGSSW